ncbi:prepilin-type N-terminal cleavage/methylation domain-containing protein [Vibrio sp. ZSDE26]|uniref:Prepilin-type N-terminal cleavage/methylation domain-containing protein n=1 Tax=Vibrio amylolyticus TaxID=2847292 RepID=A0A9X2BMW8_9VIBR|nr:type IV pilin protein [Vibrio amylolyticus]MCK6265358.1 prepilin-type N-terminal cleavage/methylation domain-containing protein [Vibrio amylolyticus]
MIQLINCNLYKKRALGMTLIELLLTISIVTILATIAYPRYTDHILKAHRTTAKADMLRMQLLLEESYQGSYDWSNLISGGSCTICDSDTDRYQFSVASSATTPYTIVATAQTTKGQHNDDCLDNDQVMKLDSKGQRIPVDCW